MTVKLIDTHTLLKTMHDFSSNNGATPSTALPPSSRFRQRQARTGRAHFSFVPRLVPFQRCG